MAKPLKAPPPYAVTSVDNALRIASMLQLEGTLTVSEIADRLGVARSTAHRLLAMLVYRDFAVRDDDHAYHPGPVLDLAPHSGSHTSRLRAVALPHLRRVVALVNETSNLAVLAGTNTRFVASVECDQAVRVGSRDGMVFPAYRTTAGLVLLAQLDDTELAALFSDTDAIDDRPNLRGLHDELAAIRRNGFALNKERSERGVVAIGVPVDDAAGHTIAGLSVSIPAMRYDERRLHELVGVLRGATHAIATDLAVLTTDVGDGVVR